MKFLLKVAIIAIAAKWVLSTPQGTSQPIDHIRELTVGEMVHHVDTVFAKIGEKLKSMIS